MRNLSNLSYSKFIEGLPSTEIDNIKSGFRGEPRVYRLSGPESLYRFAGFDASGRENNAKGSWWMSNYQYNEYQERAMRMNVPTSDFVKYKIALPKAWNNMSNLFQMDIPGGYFLDALIGVATHQPFLRSDLPANEQANFQHGKIVFIGGAEQIYFKNKDIEKFSVQQVFNW